MKIDAALRTRLKKRIKEELKNTKDRQVTVKSAIALKETDMTALKKALPQLKDAQLTNDVDPSIVAGLVIIDGSKIIDVSVKGTLQDLVTSLI